MATPLVLNGPVKISTAATSQAYLESSKAKDTIVLLPELRRQFHHLGWVSGTGGSITIKVHDDSIPKPNQLIAMSYSSFQKVRMVKSINVNIRNSTIPTKAMKVVSENGKGPSKSCIVLDIEGTTTPISFVTDVLFPYARENVRRHLYETYGSDETHEDIKLLRAQVEEDLEKGISDAVPIPPDDASKDDIITALVANVEAMIKADRKITSLKQLQGHIWQTGFRNNELEGAVFDDVPEAFEKWHSLGIKVYIYSSGSRLAQRLIFGHTNYGDLRKYLCGFFDTTIGNKKETRSYIEIAESLGVDNRWDILFLTDVYQEAIAAKSAGLEVIISVRPGNGPLPENHGFGTIKSFLEIEP